MHTLGKRAYRKVSGVRIPLFPPVCSLFFSFFIVGICAYCYYGIFSLNFFYKINFYGDVW